MIHLMDMSIDRNGLGGRLRPAHYRSRFCNYDGQGTRDPSARLYFQSSSEATHPLTQVVLTNADADE